MDKNIKPGSREKRSFLVERQAINVEARTVELAFSSEVPYQRWWGIEILDHSPGAVDLTRMKSGGPLLVEHDGPDLVGIIESVQIGADRVGRAVVRFGKSARAVEIFNDVVDGIRKSVSVAYMVNKSVLQSSDGDVDTYLIENWTPYEISLVSIPADVTVGVGRSQKFASDVQGSVEKLKQAIELHQAHMDGSEPTSEESQMQMMDMMKDAVSSLDDEALNQIKSMEQKEMKMADKEIDVKDIEARASAAGRDAEAKRASEIIAIGKQYKNESLAWEHASSGRSVEDFKAALLVKMSTAPMPTAEIGLTDKEVQSYSFLRALNALSNPGDRKAQEAAKYERECSDAVGAKMGRAAQGYFVPVEVQKRDLTVGTSTAGGHTVATILSANFIDLLRNRMMVMRMGSQMLSGLVGNIAIPRQTGGATAYWVAESGAPTESQQAFDQVTMSPKTVGAFTDISRKLLLQSSLDVEGFVRNDLATVLALAIDLAAINGSGASNQPTGILNTSGIGDVAGGTNGAAPTWAHIIELWSDIAVANADFGNVGMLTNAKVVGKLMSTLKASGVAGYIVENFPDANGLTNSGGSRIGVSNQVPSNLTKGTASGVCSAIINGNWNDLIIGQWGSLDLMVDPYTGATSGTVRVVALQDIDLAVRHPESFSAFKDVLTT